MKQVNKNFVHAAHRRGGVAIVAIVCLVVLSIVVGVYLMSRNNGNGFDTSKMSTQVAVRGPFNQIVIESGQIESSNKSSVICQVRTSWFDGIEILWVLDEGTRVEAGDKVVELDASKLEERSKAMKINVLQTESLVQSAKAILEQAKIARREYIEGMFKSEESTILMELSVAEEDLRKAEQALNSSKRLMSKGLLSQLQVEGDLNAFENAAEQRDTAQSKLSVLRNLTREKMLVQFDTEIEAARAELASAEAKLALYQRWHNSILHQIRKCTMYAPSDGVVVHENKFSMRGGNAEFIVEPGAAVRQSQTIVRLPDPEKMQVVCKVNESRVTMLKAGMLAKISINALPHLNLTGRVAKVNLYAEPDNYGSTSGVKKYATYIEIANPPAELRSGMTADVQILVNQFDDAIQIPLEALYEYGGRMYSMIRNEDDRFETVEVEINATNDTLASIGSGVSENDRVVLDLRNYRELMELPELLAEDTSGYRALNTVQLTNDDKSGDVVASGVDGRPIAHVEEITVDETDG